MSAFPRDPEHFFRWVRNHHDKEAQPQDFIPRSVYGDYIHGLLQTAAEYPGNARLERREEAVVGIARRGDRFTVRLSSGQSIVARAVVLVRDPNEKRAIKFFAWSNIYLMLVFTAVMVDVFVRR